MKSLKLIFIGIGLFLISSLQAQVRVSENTGTQPPWGLVGSPDLRYYYLPDVEAYYDIHTSMFIYYDRGNWIHKANLPKHYKNYNLKNEYKVGITDYSGETPYIYFSIHKLKYAKSYHGKEIKITFRDTLGINIGSQSRGFARYSKVRYYFLPDAEAYYDAQTSTFICYEGNWVHRANLPVQYNDYNLNNGYKVAITDYVGEVPYTYFYVHKTLYPKGCYNKEKESVFKDISGRYIK